MKKGKSRKAFARRNVIRNQKRRGHPFNNKSYSPNEYDGSQNQDEET
jgi:hypothetical protein